MSPSSPAKPPIFIHSLFRSASTYFFHKFRALGPDFTCYQEPFNEMLGVLNNPRRHDELLIAPQYESMRHPALDKPYFDEFWRIRKPLQGLFRKSFSYEQYFTADAHAPLPAGQRRYVAALVEHSAGRPVLQCCRSSGRMQALRQAFGGLHIHLWREPRIQWWSYKIHEYFDRANQKIHAATLAPPALRQVAAAAGIVPGKLRPLDARGSYMAFYGLWLDAWLRLQPACDMDICLDVTSTSRSEAGRIEQQLDAWLGRRIDLSDLKARGMHFTGREQSFYAPVETAVGNIFLETRHCGSAQLQQAVDAAARARAAHRQEAHDAITECSLREAAIAMMDRLAETTHPRLWRWRGPIPQGLAKLRSYLPSA